MKKKGKKKAGELMKEKTNERDGVWKIIGTLPRCKAGDKILSSSRPSSRVVFVVC